MAPSGAVAQFKDFSLREFVMNLLFADVAAAITGLEPVTGATVDLIRIDDDGNQVGEVLASTVTSVTGDYTLTLPAGVDLSGDLIVRITGAGDSELRAQVVDQTVDISPVSEFILRKFIADGTDLGALETTAVVKLSGQVEEFDLTAGSDLSALFDQLEASVGEFVESQIAVIESAPASATDFSGDYRSASLQIFLSDSDANSFGSFAIDMWSSSFTFTGNADGSVDIVTSGEESAWGNLYGNDATINGISYYAEIDQEVEVFSASFTDANLILIEGEFEEEIDGDWGWRWPPMTYRLQKVKDQNLFFHLNQEASVRYETIDTNADSIKDAVNPDARQGDEVNRGLEVFFKSPSDMTTADLSGTFGRVYFGVFMYGNGDLTLEMETNELIFNNGTFDYGAAVRNEISRNSTGILNAQTVTTPAEEGLTISLGANGDIVSINGEAADGFVNDAADLVVFAESNGEDETEADFSQTFLVKLPTSTPDLASKRYRLMFVDTYFGDTSFEVNNSRFESFITWTDNNAGTLALQSGTISKTSLGANVNATVHPADQRAVSAEVAANGAATINITDEEGVLRLKGFWNETASYGLFTVGHVPNGANEFESVGLAILVEVSE